MSYNNALLNSCVRKKPFSQVPQPSPLLHLAAIALLGGTLVMHGCSARSVPHEAILGKWKSDAQLTLQSMYQTKGLTSHSRAFLSDEFFGYMETEIRETESRTTNNRDNYDSGFEPYTVIEVTDQFVRIKAWSNFFQDFDERTLYLEGDCFYEIFKVFQFRQYFCRNG